MSAATNAGTACATSSGAAGRRYPRTLRRRIAVIEHDVTDGAADAVIAAAARGEVPERAQVPEAPLPGAPYDLVVADLLYSQLLYPAMLDLRVPERRRRCFLERYAPTLVRGRGPRESDPRAALAHFAIPMRATALWRWPFAPDTDYLVCATVAGPIPPHARELPSCGQREHSPIQALRHGPRQSSRGQQRADGRSWSRPFGKRPR
jgi:hypothetical protein